jgi:hypothetical protein
MLLITVFVELHVVAGRIRMRAGSPQAISTAVLCRGLEKNSIVRAWHGHGHGKCESDTAYCLNQTAKTHSKPSAERHGRSMLCVNQPLML